MRAVRALAAAWSLLTIVPLPAALGRRLDAADWARSAAAFPSVGLALGIAVAALAHVCAGALGPWAGAACAVLGSAILTAGLHLDGLADACDALGARGTGEAQRQRRLEIMRDSSTGTYGTLGLIAALLLQTTALASLALAGPTGTAAAIVLAMVVGRAAGVLHAALLPSARVSGLGASFTVSRTSLTVALGSAVIFGGLIAAGWVVHQHDPAAAGAPATALLGALLGAALATALARSKLGGRTGDTIGATIVVGETAALLGFLAAA